MKKIFPIKVEKSITMNYKFIEWKLHNVCNNDCSFCGDRHKDGSQRWFDLDVYKTYVDKLVALCEGKPIWFQLTGGEPTLFPETLELIQYIKSKGAYISLLSNGARTLRWWKELRDLNALNALFLTYHSEQTGDYKHIADVVNLFHDEPIKVVTLITHTKDTIDRAFEAFDFLLENTGVVVVMKAMVIRDYDIYSLYTEEQLDKIKRSVAVGKIPNKKPTTIPPEFDLNHTLNITYSDSTIKQINPQALMKMQDNRFEGWNCDIGQDTMRIDYDVVYRGVCEVGGVMSLADEDLNFKTDSVVCNAGQCFCGTDMVANKTLPIEKYPA